MKINPINANHKVNFGAEIKPTKSLKDGFDMIERSVNSAMMKDMNYAKDFIDSLARISESKKVDKFSIEIDKRRADYTYTKINGRRINGGHNDRVPNVQDSYLVVEGIKNYASKLEDIEPSILDNVKEQIAEAQFRLDELKSRYSDRLKAEFEQAKKFVFHDVS